MKKSNFVRGPYTGKVIFKNGKAIVISQRRSK